MLDNIERIKAPSREVFFDEYVRNQRPVIITDLFDGQPIRELDSVDKARQTLGDMPVIVQEGHEEYFSRVFRALHTASPIPHAQLSESTVDGYLDFVAANPDTRLVCAEVPKAMIGRVEARYEPPVYCRGPHGEVEDFKPMLWLGGAGNFTHLHYDGDHRHVLQYQLWGRKSVILLPPSASKKIGPLRNNSLMSPEGMTDEETDRFVEYCDGWRAVVGTGETLYMPAMIWHYFEYLDTSMALTMRFSRNKYTALLGDNCHIDYRLQALASKFIDERDVTDELRRAFDEIHALLIQPMEDPFARGQLMQAVYDRLYRQLCPDSVQGELVRPFINPIAELIRHIDIVNGKLYQGQLTTIDYQGQPVETAA